MEVIIALLIAMAAAIVIAILGRVGQNAHKEEHRLTTIQAHYSCDREDAVQLLYYMRKGKVNHVLNKSGLTL